MTVSEVGKMIRDRREQLGLTQDRLAELASLDRAAIARYESGEAEPGAQALSGIADALETTVDRLLGRDEQENDPVVPDLDHALVDLLVSLSPEQLKRVQDFVAGMKASETT